MPVIDQKITDQYAVYHSDVMEVLPALPGGSVGLSVYSPPFPELYQYSDDPRDVTNSTSYGEALEQLAFVVREVARLTMPGRLSCVHCTDLKRGPLYQHDFPGDLIRTHEAAGMRFFCRVTIAKDAWEFARRTRMKSLMHKTLCEDSARSRIAPGDYLLMFLKPGDNPEPVTHERGFREYAGGTPVPANLQEYEEFKGENRENILSHWIYRRYASNVWDDIRRGRLLPYAAARESPEEKHVCPLQLDVIDRCLAMWSNPGDTVLTPFLGAGSEAYEAVRMGRKAIGCELKATYYRQAVANLLRLAAGDDLPADEDGDGAEPCRPRARAAKQTSRALAGQTDFLGDGPGTESD